MKENKQAVEIRVPKCPSQDAALGCRRKLHKFSVDTGKSVCADVHIVCAFSWGL